MAVADLLVGKTAAERKTIKVAEMLKLGVPPRQKVDGVDVEILSLAASVTQGAVEVFVRAWNLTKKPYGFGPDRGAEIKRITLRNPPIMVPDGTFHEETNYHGWKIQVANFREDLPAALVTRISQVVRLVGQVGKTVRKGEVAYSTFVDSPEVGAVSPCDGAVGVGSQSGSFAALMAANGNYSEELNTLNTAPFLRTVVSGDNLWRDWYTSVFGFPTNLLDDGVTINSAIFSVYVAAKSNALSGSPVLELVLFTPADTSNLANTDHPGGYTKTRQATGIAYASISTGAMNNITLNATGLANISKTAPTFFALDWDWSVDESFSGTWAADSATYIDVRMVDYEGTTYDPYITIEYTAASLSVTAGTLEIEVEVVAATALASGTAAVVASTLEVEVEVVAATASAATTTLTAGTLEVELEVVAATATASGTAAVTAATLEAELEIVAATALASGTVAVTAGTLEVELEIVEATASSGTIATATTLEVEVEVVAATVAVSGTATTTATTLEIEIEVVAASVTAATEVVASTLEAELEIVAATVAVSGTATLTASTLEMEMEVVSATIDTGGIVAAVIRFTIAHPTVRATIAHPEVRAYIGG